MMTDEHGRRLIHIDDAISKLEHFGRVARERLSALPEQLTTDPALRKRLQLEMPQVLGISMRRYGRSSPSWGVTGTLEPAERKAGGPRG